MYSADRIMLYFLGQSIEFFKAGLNRSWVIENQKRLLRVTEFHRIKIV